MTRPSAAMRVASQEGTRPPCRGRSAYPLRVVMPRDAGALPTGPGRRKSPQRHSLDSELVPAGSLAAVEDTHRRPMDHVHALAESGGDPHFDAPVIAALD